MKFRTRCYRLVIRLRLAINRLAIQVVRTRQIQDVRNKLQRACCHQFVNNLFRADGIRLVRTTCCELVGLIDLVTR